MLFLDFFKKMEHFNANERNKMSNTELKNLVDRSYQNGFETDVESIHVPKGLSAEVIHFISTQKTNASAQKNINMFTQSGTVPKTPPIV